MASAAEIRHDVLSAGARTAPAAAIVAADEGLKTVGLSLNDWVMILTGIYIALQILYLLYKFGRDIGWFRRRRERQAPQSNSGAWRTPQDE